MLTQLLPPADQRGHYRYPDGSGIWPSPGVRGKWVACWADRTMLQSDGDVTSYFCSPEEAAQALLDGGEGPASLPAI